MGENLCPVFGRTAGCSGPATGNHSIIGWQGIVEDNPNLDSSVLIRCGNQQGAKWVFNPKKQGQPSEHPVLAFPSSGYVVNVWNRSGDTRTGHGAVPFFRQTLLSLGSNFHGNRVLRDSGSYKVEFIAYLKGKHPSLFKDLED